MEKGYAVRCCSCLWGPAELEDDELHLSAAWEEADSPLQQGHIVGCMTFLALSADSSGRGLSGMTEWMGSESYGRLSVRRSALSASSADKGMEALGPP